MEKTLKESFSVFGKTTLRKFTKLKIYVEGLSKIGPDLVTNLVLLNPHLITLHDPELIHPEDPYRTYLYHKDQVGKKSRADYIIQICHRLNSKVYVDKINTELTQQTCLKYDIIIFCDIYDLGRVLAIDKAIRQKKQKSVVMYACQMGYCGVFISDFGQEWQMFHSGQEPPKISVKNITNEQKGQVTTETPHNYQTGDFISINYVEGMRYVNGDARPIRVKDQYTFQIEDTRNFGKYVKSGLCQKINLVQKLKFPSFEDQLAKRHSQMMLVAKAIICFYQNNSKLPELFHQGNLEETFENLKTLAAKFDQKYDENECKNVIKTCDYSFYPLVHMFSAIISLECVKCTGKYRPIKSPFLVDWYDRISFEVKKKSQGQFVNIIDTNTLQKLAKLQQQCIYLRVGIVDDGSQSLQLLNLLYSCSISQKTRVILCGLESINEYNEMDGIILKAQIKYQVTNELFKNKKTETIPCSLSFSNDLILGDMWKKIKLLINTSSRLNSYVYNNVIWNQIQVVDSIINELSGQLKISSSNKSCLQQTRAESSSIKEQIKQYKDCVEQVLEYFRLIFIDIFEDMRCFFICGAPYIDQVKMTQVRKNIFLYTICCLEDGSHVQPENIVKICKYIFHHTFPEFELDQKDQLIMDFMKSLFFLIGWFFTKKEFKIQEISNYFILHLNKIQDQPILSQKDKYNIAYTKLAMGNQFSIPYLSLSDLYRKEHTIKFIWNGSQILAKRLTIDEEITSKKFYKYYLRKIKPCPFMGQIINSLIPLSVLESVYNKINNFEVDMISGKFSPKECPPPKKLKAPNGVTLVPANSNQWTIIIIEGPKKVSQIIDRFNYMQQVKVKKIRIGNLEIYNSVQTKKNIYFDVKIQNIATEKRDEFELHVEAEDTNGQQCEVCRVKYIVK